MFLFSTDTSNSVRGVACGCSFYMRLISLCCRQLRLCGMERIDRGLMSGANPKFVPGGGRAEETQEPTRPAPQAEYLVFTPGFEPGIFWVYCMNTALSAVTFIVFAQNFS